MSDTHAAATFVACTARLLDRRRHDFFFSGGSSTAVRDALVAYRNDDGGFGQALEPDVRAPSSQPAPVQYALEFLAEIGAPGDDPLVAGALDWVASVASPSGGVGLLVGDFEGWPRAPWFGPSEDSFLTAGIAGSAWRLGARHEWLDRATEFCWTRVAEQPMTADIGSAYWWKFLLHFLDHVGDRPRAESELERIREPLLASGVVGLDPHAEAEQLSLLVMSPSPGLASRVLFDDDLIDAFLDALAAGQADDGGWTPDWSRWNDATWLEWRGNVTVGALHQLDEHGRL